MVIFKDCANTEMFIIYWGSPIIKLASTNENMGTAKEIDLLRLLQRETYGFPYDKIVYDADGVPLELGLLDKKYVPPFGELSYRKIRELRMNENDVLLCGYPKTGCHWTWEILQMIISGKAEYSNAGKVISFMEMVPVDLMDTMAGPRVLNTHLWFDYLPKQVTEKKVKIVFTMRNPKDTAVSFYNHHISKTPVQRYNGTFKNWFELFLRGEVDYGNYFNYHVEWDKAIRENPEQPILLVSYEDMKEDLPREIDKMCSFLGVSLDDHLAEEISKAAGFEVMKKQFIATGNISRELIRKGQVGDWKNWLTVTQSEIIDAAVEENLQGTCFKMRYTI